MRVCVCGGCICVCVCVWYCASLPNFETFSIMWGTIKVWLPPHTLPPWPHTHSQNSLAACDRYSLANCQPAQKVMWLSLLCCLTPTAPQQQNSYFQQAEFSIHRSNELPSIISEITIKATFTALLNLPLTPEKNMHACSIVVFLPLFPVISRLYS